MNQSFGRNILRAALFCGAVTFGSLTFADPTFAQDAAASAEAEVDDEGLTFFDSVSFDQSLSSELSKKPEATMVLPSGPFSPNQIPVRLEKWLAVVSKNGGSVKLKRDNGGVPTRGILSDVVELTVKTNAEAEQNALYSNAKNYDVTVFFKGNEVTSVRFVRKAEPAEAEKK